MSKKFKLRADWTAQQNLWEAAKVATVCILRRYNVYNKAEERKELFDDIMLRGVQNFMNEKVMNHKYDRNYTFLQNVTSSVWQSAGFLIDKYLSMTRRRISALPLDAEVKNYPGHSIAETVPDTTDNRVGYAYRQIKQPILSVLDRERFGFSKGDLPLKSDPESVLRAVWAVEDDDIEGFCGIVTEEEKARREEIVQMLPKPSRTTVYNREYKRRIREQQRKATN